MSEWIDIQSPALIKYDIETVENNINYIIEQLNAQGSNIPLITLQTVNYNSDLEKIKTVLNNVESELLNLDKQLNFITRFTDFKWTSATIKKRERVQEWIIYINDLYNILSGNKPKTVFLTDINGSFIIDSSGNYITVKVSG